MTDNLPAEQTPRHLTLPNLDAFEVGHFDGWTAADVEQWLTDTIPAFALAEGRVQALRRGVGLALWRLCQELGEPMYGAVCVKMAQAAGVSIRTIGRWRTDAEAPRRLGSFEGRKMTGQLWNGPGSRRQRRKWRPNRHPSLRPFVKGGSGRLGFRRSGPTRTPLHPPCRASSGTRKPCFAGRLSNSRRGWAATA